jgi:two-component system cell cycle response regulator CpdR
MNFSGERKGSGVVFVVEDEPAVRRLISKVLETLGYSTLQAHSGLEALRKLCSTEPLDAMIIDLGLPGDHDGYELCKQVGRLRPDVKVLYITGHPAEHPTVRKASQYAGVLRKPFSMQDLREAIAHLMLSNDHRPAHVCPEDEESLSPAI